MSDVPPQEQPPVPGDEPLSGAPPSFEGETERVMPTRPVLQPPPARVKADPVAAPQLSQRSAPAPAPKNAAQRRRAGAAPPPVRTRAPIAQAAPQPAVPRRSARRRAVPPSESGWYLPWWSLVVMIATVGMIAFGLLLTVTELSEPHVPGNQTPRVQIVTALPTLSQDFLPGAAQPGMGPTPIPQAFPTPTVPLPTPIPSPTLPPGDFAIGMTVQVVGVGTSGLNIRSSPGYTGTPRFLAAEQDTFVITEGPQTVDGLEWWRLQDPDDPDRFGWAARNYLAGISQ